MTLGIARQATVAGQAPLRRCAGCTNQKKAIALKSNVERSVSALKRALREGFRRRALPDVDIIVMARPGAADVTPERLGEAVGWLFERLAGEA